VPNFVALPNSVSTDSGATFSKSTLGIYSSDGITWSTTTMPFSFYWSGVAYGKDRFVAVGSDDTATDKAVTSTDGITWTQITMPVSSSWRDVRYGNGLFIAPRLASSDVYEYSTDGITWSTSTAAALPDTRTWKYFTWGAKNSLYVGVGLGSNRAVSSTDGISWTLRTLPGVRSWGGLAYGNGAYVVTTIGSTLGAISTNGTTWANTTLPANARWRLTYGRGYFLATSESTTNAATSEDGITWTSRTAGNLYAATTSGAGVYVGIGTYGYTAPTNVSIGTSTDGITWTARTMPSAGNGGSWESGNIAYGR
jgi:hypothetical protein